ncbi:MAG: ankyrin repeat domain-containing protein [Bacteroidia bacterium]|nr:ankyrin repeat domain-containing protein [Bacteroidia bacterium]
MKTYIDRGDVSGLQAYLLRDNTEVNVPLFTGPEGKHPVHPLNYVCDRVYAKIVDQSAGLAMVEVLVNAGAKPNGHPDQLDTPLLAACRMRCDDIALYLIDLGVDLSARGTHGGTALHWASWIGSDRVVERLLLENVNVEDDQNQFQCTPLHWALDGWLNEQGNLRGQQRVTELLVKAGAALDARNREMKSAREILQRAGLDDWLQRLDGWALG